MIETTYNGNFGLDEIKRIIQRRNPGGSFYEIRFVNDKRKMYICELNSFMTDEMKPKSIYDLKSGDKIWIDIGVFSKDGTLK